MAILTRLTRLFRADVHAVLDRMEEPDVLLRQALREMEDEVAQQAQQLKAHELERQQAQTRLEAIASTRKDLSEQLDLCFAAKNEALSRTLLRRRLEGERLTKLLDQRLAALDKAIADRGAQLDEQRRSLEGLRQKAELFETESTQPRSDVGGWRTEDYAVSDADVELAWLREQQQRSAP